MKKVIKDSCDTDVTLADIKVCLSHVRELQKITGEYQLLNIFTVVK